MELGRAKNACLILIIYFNLIYHTLNAECLNHLTNHLKKNLLKYQVQLFSSKDAQETKTVTSEIIQNNPSLQLDLRHASLKNLNDWMELPAFSDPRKTTLFIVIDSSTNGTHSSNATTPLNFLTRLSPARIRPRCLFIITNNSQFGYDKFLREMWINRFLDTTLVQLKLPETTTDRLEQSFGMKGDVHYYNPFTDVYVKEKCSSKTIWFPDKLSDLKGYNVKAGVMNWPPYSYVEFNRTGHPINFQGEEALILKALQKALNFSVSLESTPTAKIGVINIRNKSATGMLGKCLTNEINIFSFTLVTSSAPTKGLYELIELNSMVTFDAIVPIVHAQPLVLQQSILYSTVLVFITLCTLVWTVTRLLRFQDKLWNPINIVQVLLGMAVTQPSTTPERFFFATLIIVSFSYLSSFHAGITSINLELPSEVRLETFEDLDESGLTPIIHPNFFESTFQYAEGALLSLRKKAIVDENAGSFCLKMLAKYKNVSCLEIGSYAEFLVESLKNAFGQPVGKILNSKFTKFRRVITLEKGSPYKERFDELQLIFLQAGLWTMWSTSVRPSGTNRGVKDVERLTIENFGRKKNLRRRLVFIMLNGFSLSIFVFLCENLVCLGARFAGKLLSRLIPH